MKVGIVGAGIFGMAAALESMRRGHETTLFESGRIPNPNGSSTDVSKAIRRTGYAHESYIELVMRAAKQWREWNNRLGDSIYYQTGTFIIQNGFDEENLFPSGWGMLGQIAEDVSQLTLSQAMDRFPQFDVRHDDKLFFDPWGGYLRSGEALKKLSAIAREGGVVVRENTMVTGIEETASGVRIIWDSESSTFDHAIIATGPWVANLLPQIKARIRLTLQQMAFFLPKDVSSFNREKFPVWSVHHPGNIWYGFPYLHEGYLKVAEDNKVVDTTVDVEREPTDEFLKQAWEIVADRIPKLCNGKLIGGRSCLYTNTEDEHFIIDWAPEHERVLLAGCGCGHGFKFGGSIGPVIIDALENKENTLGDLFRIGDRFGPI
ncbi:MAG: hypothetical protein CMN58_06125 [Solibacterales bacterium]|uniref:Monomeric sarcosine oxidase n=1 Tax=Candidatus Moanibacter tarae TaxID=2200854 RepID=A0A2Z4AJK9_9BACT|nr:MAG: Monomeric sarcosine oxidase [Candidatus Moanabacter tarae]MBG99904.1 hypothetical protein [Bryobacterales bacterium]|tara:strand:+ start:6847 stop:7974 length:1128 start_codon:yes stop_codon:yes gene_type:complete